MTKEIPMTETTGAEAAMSDAKSWALYNLKFVRDMKDNDSTIDFACDQIEQALTEPATASQRYVQELRRVIDLSNMDIENLIREREALRDQHAKLMALLQPLINRAGEWSEGKEPSTTFSSFTANTCSKLAGMMGAGK